MKGITLKITNKKQLRKIIEQNIFRKKYLKEDFEEDNLKEIKNFPEYKKILKYFFDKTLLKNGSLAFQCKDRPNLVYSITNSGYLRRGGPIFKSKNPLKNPDDYKIIFYKMWEDYQEILRVERKYQSVRHLGRDYGMKYEKYFVSDEKFRKDNLMWKNSEKLDEGKMNKKIYKIKENKKFLKTK